MPSQRRNKSLSVWTKSVDVDWKETGLKNGVLSKTNEPGARGIGTGMLNEINRDIKKMEILTKQSGKLWHGIRKTC